MSNCDRNIRTCDVIINLTNNQRLQASELLFTSLRHHDVQIRESEGWRERPQN